MPLRWSDTREIAIALEEAHPDVDNVNLRYTDLHRWICALPDFADQPHRLEREGSRSDPDGLDRRAGLTP